MSDENRVVTRSQALAAYHDLLGSAMVIVSEHLRRMHQGMDRVRAVAYAAGQRALMAIDYWRLTLMGTMDLGIGTDETMCERANMMLMIDLNMERNTEQHRRYVEGGLVQQGYFYWHRVTRAIAGLVWPLPNRDRPDLW